jgi:hypothetical protein
VYAPVFPSPRRTTGVIWLKESDLDALIGEVALRLGEVYWSMVWGRMPNSNQLPLNWQNRKSRLARTKLPVHQEGDLVGRHIVRATFNKFIVHMRKGIACPFARII